MTCPYPSATIEAESAIRRWPDCLTRMKTLDEYLEEAARVHGHLCAGQVLGVRMALLGLARLGITDPIGERKRLVTFVEIDRCATDAIALVTGCRLGKRALKLPIPTTLA